MTRQQQQMSTSIVRFVLYNLSSISICVDCNLFFVFSHCQCQFTPKKRGKEQVHTKEMLLSSLIVRTIDWITDDCIRKRICNENEPSSIDHTINQLA